MTQLAEGFLKIKSTERVRANGNVSILKDFHHGSSRTEIVDGISLLFISFIVLLSSSQLEV